jgi:hypothetical protein
MFSAGNAKTDPQRVYARAGAMHAGFAQCAAFDQDAIDIGGVEKFVLRATPNVRPLGSHVPYKLPTGIADPQRMKRCVRSQYRSGRSPHWIKSKNPNAPAVKRETEEDWGR